VILFECFNFCLISKTPNFMPNRQLVSINHIPYKKAALSFFWCAVIISLSACSAHYGAAKIVSSPSGAEVTNGEDGSVIGHTPLTMHWKNANGNRQTIILKLKKAGYYEKTSSFWLDMRQRNAKVAAANPQLVQIEMQKVGE